MTWSRAHYDDVRRELQPRDVIAIGGTGGLAAVIKCAILGTVNHVAVVLSSDLPEDGTSQEGPLQPQTRRVRIMESTSALDDFPDVNARGLGKWIEGHMREARWLPLRAAFDDQWARAEVCFCVVARGSGSLHFAEHRDPL